MSEDLFGQKGINGTVYVNSYWGGTKDKECIQVTTPMAGYIQFTRKEARRFARNILKHTEER